jgi:hypothetical protein
LFQALTGAKPDIEKAETCAGVNKIGLEGEKKRRCFVRSHRLQIFKEPAQCGAQASCVTGAMRAPAPRSNHAQVCALLFRSSPELPSSLLPPAVVDATADFLQYGHYTEENCLKT